MEDYLFGFDINNPEWIAQRERAWISLEKEMKKDLTMKKIKFYKEIFFKGSCEPGHPCCDVDSYLNQKSSMFLFYPQQCEEFWTYYVKKHYVERYAEKGWSDSYVNAIESLDYFERTKEKYGWTVDQEVRAHKFFHGERYIPGEVEFLGEKIINPLSASDVVSHWSREVRKWLGCVCDDNKYIHLMDYFFDALLCLDKKVFGLPMLDIKEGGPAQYNLQKLINTVFNYDKKKLIKEYKKDKRNTIVEECEIVNKKRDEYVNKLKVRFLNISEPHELVELIKTCSNKKFKSEWDKFI